MEYINREGEIYTFTLDGDNNILWRGDFLFSRRLLNSENPNKIEAIDPSGGPFIQVGINMGYVDESFDGKIIEDFVKIDDGYKILIRK